MWLEIVLGEDILNENIFLYKLKDFFSFLPYRTLFFLDFVQLLDSIVRPLIIFDQKLHKVEFTKKKLNARELLKKRAKITKKFVRFFVNMTNILTNDETNASHVSYVLKIMNPMIGASSKSAYVR